MPRKTNVYGPGIYRKDGQPTYYVRLEIPADVRSKFRSDNGKPMRRFKQSLRTDDLKKARREAPAILNEWKARIEEARGEPDDAARIRHNLQRARAKGDVERSAAILAEVSDRHSDIASSASVSWVPGHNEPSDYDVQQATEAAQGAADDFAERATGIKTPFMDHVDGYISQAEVKPKTAGMYRKALKDFSEHCPNISDVTVASVNAYFGAMLERVKFETIKKDLNPLRGYWRYLQHVEAVQDDFHPFDDIRVLRLAKRKDKNGNKKTKPRDVFTPAQARTLFTKTEGTERDFFMLLAYTGARPQELCHLKTDEVAEDHFKIVDAKTVNGIRDVPIHPEIRQIVTRLLDESTDGYLIPGLKTDKHGNRYDSIRHKLERAIAGMEFEEKLTPYSFRNTVNTQLINKGVPDSTINYILGWSQKGMAHSVYSRGLTLANKADALFKVEYAPAAPETAVTGLEAVPGLDPA